MRDTSREADGIAAAIERIETKLDILLGLRSVSDVAGREDVGDDGLLARFTRRQHAVIALMVAGLPDADVAEDLGVATNTVKSHVANVVAKTGVGRKAEAVALLSDALSRIDDETYLRLSGIDRRTPKGGSRRRRRQG